MDTLPFVQLNIMVPLIWIQPYLTANTTHMSDKTHTRKASNDSIFASAQCTSQAKEWPGLSSCRRTRRWARGGSRRWRRRWSWSPSPSSSFIPSGPAGKCLWFKSGLKIEVLHPNNTVTTCFEQSLICFSATSLSNDKTWQLRSQRGVKIKCSAIFKFTVESWTGIRWDCWGRGGGGWTADSLDSKLSLGRGTEGRIHCGTTYRHIPPQQSYVATDWTFEGFSQSSY